MLVKVCEFIISECLELILTWGWLLLFQRRSCQSIHIWAWCRRSDQRVWSGSGWYVCWRETKTNCSSTSGIWRWLH